MKDQDRQLVCIHHCSISCMSSLQKSMNLNHIHFPGQYTLDPAPWLWLILICKKHDILTFEFWWYTVAPSAPCKLSLNLLRMKSSKLMSYESQTWENSGHSSWPQLWSSEIQISASVMFLSRKNTLLSKKPLSSFVKYLKSKFFHPFHEKKKKAEGIRFHTGERMEICWCSVRDCVCAVGSVSSCWKVTKSSSGITTASSAERWSFCLELIQQSLQCHLHLSSSMLQAVNAFTESVKTALEVRALTLSIIPEKSRSDRKPTEHKCSLFFVFRKNDIWHSSAVLLCRTAW